MNPPNESSIQSPRAAIDRQRRRLAKGGLAAPIVIGTLLSRPVLGAAHNCTISGQQSGNVSTHVQGVCSTLGKSPSTLAGNTAIWPAEFKDGSGNPLLFKNAPKATPSYTGTTFANAFAGPGGVGDATLLQVLNGTATVKLGSSATVALGREAVAAAMNALDGTNGHPVFPVHAADAVEMFNDISAGGNYVTADYGGVNWSITDVINYLQLLHP